MRSLLQDQQAAALETCAPCFPVHPEQLPHSTQTKQGLPCKSQHSKATSKAGHSSIRCFQNTKPSTPTCSQLRCCLMVIVPLELAHQMLPKLSTATAVTAARSAEGAKLVVLCVEVL